MAQEGAVQWSDARCWRTGSDAPFRPDAFTMKSGLPIRTSFLAWGAEATAARDGERADGAG
jgi:hypothetical protein